jgi:hypothetical protein
MNERIKKLAKQAEEFSHWTNHGHTANYRINPEKFAELIVKECIEICNQHPSKTFKKEWDADVVAWDITQRIKGRFGVEE